MNKTTKSSLWPKSRRKRHWAPIKMKMTEDPCRKVMHATDVPRGTKDLGAIEFPGLLAFFQYVRKYVLYNRVDVDIDSTVGTGRYNVYAKFIPEDDFRDYDDVEWRLSFNTGHVFVNLETNHEDTEPMVSFLKATGHIPVSLMNEF